MFSSKNNKLPAVGTAVWMMLMVAFCMDFMQPAESLPMGLASARQFLPPIPGYIPVYIRQGDTPLEDINLELAEAFRSYAEKHARLNSLDARSRNLLISDDKRKSSGVGDENKLDTDKAFASGFMGKHQQEKRTSGVDVDKDQSNNSSPYIQKIKPKS